MSPRSFFGGRDPRHNSATNPIADLRQAVADLEADLAETERQLATASSELDLCHARAQECVRSGDDRSAKAALGDKSEAQGRLERFDADAAVLKAMIAECQAVLEAAQAQGQAPSVPAAEENPAPAKSE